MPVKNEAWILAKALGCASLWADHIIVADQGSTDGSPAIARRFPKVTLLSNRSPTFSEAKRQQLLLDAARSIPGRRVIFALDADELLAADWRACDGWTEILAAPEGTRIRLPKAELQPGLTSYGVIEGGDVVHAIVDDGSPLNARTIHGPRLPVSGSATVMRPASPWLLHYRTANPARNNAKQRWYQCWERVNNPSKRPISIFRQYHQDGALARDPRPVDPAWFTAYLAQGIDVLSVETEATSWWDAGVLQLFAEYGLETFRKLDVFGDWWETIPTPAAHDITQHWPYDPRTAAERIVHRWLHATQAHSASRLVRAAQRALVPAGW